MQREAYVLSAFTKDGAGGNPAGVVLDTNGLTEVDMRNIARQLGYSETAFVLPSTLVDYRVRYFTPNEEVDICGHATIATFSLLLQRNLISKSTYLIETRAGIMKVMINENQTVSLQQNRPEFGPVLPSEEILNTLGINEEQLLPYLPIQCVSTGLRDIIVPVKSLSILNELKPKYKAIKEISKKYDAVGYHVFTLETINSSSAHCRNFAPLYDIDEESATGTASAALACYLAKNLKPQTYYRFEQGYLMGRPSEIFVNLSFYQEEIKDIQIGGKSSQYEKFLFKDGLLTNQNETFTFPKRTNI
ncbi:PhzF family phenazine biosynthesis protein [Bacillus sp. CGMCC 1.16607]|uniref:PhzF family phenazine biosynthesis protein n=1 Tax=Bacillus sp. CGMCC 1.16607 TaxID=3351842 RepID=UPI0036265F53